jgi:hypothetical protein
MVRKGPFFVILDGQVAYGFVFQIACHNMEVSVQYVRDLFVQKAKVEGMRDLDLSEYDCKNVIDWMIQFGSICATAFAI